MAIDSDSAVAVATSPVSLAEGGSNGAAVLLKNYSGTTVYLGGSATMGTLTGFRLEGTASVGLYVEQGEAIYGVTASGTASVDVLRGGVA